MGPEWKGNTLLTPSMRYQLWHRVVVKNCGKKMSARCMEYSGYFHSMVSRSCPLPSTDYWIEVDLDLLLALSDGSNIIRVRGIGEHVRKTG